MAAILAADVAGYSRLMGADEEGTLARLKAHRRELVDPKIFAEWGDVFGDPVVATALLDRLLHHAVLVQIEGSSYRMRQHADLIPEHVRSTSPSNLPPVPKRRGRRPSKAPTDQTNG